MEFLPRRMLTFKASIFVKFFVLITVFVSVLLSSLQSHAQSRAVVVDLDDGLFVVIPIQGFVAPNDIEAVQVGATSLTLSWSASIGAASYRLERYVNGSWVVVYSGSNLSFTANGLPTGNLLFRISACDAQGDCGKPSSDLTVTVVRTQSVDYVYDALGRLKQVTDPNNGNRVYNYDKAGNRTSVSAQ